MLSISALMLTVLNIYLLILTVNCVNTYKSTLNVYIFFMSFTAAAQLIYCVNTILYVLLQYLSEEV